MSPPYTQLPSYTQSQKSSLDSARTASNSNAEKQSSLRRVVQKVKQAAKEHHESVNAAYEALYGRQAYSEKGRVEWR